MEKQAHIYYAGRVQGVGFRLTANTIANKLGISGWVKNLSDGRVEVVVEGQDSLIDSFILEMKKAFSHYLTDVDISWGKASGEIEEFTVKF